jgi:serine/threonine-protein kinase
VLERGLAKDPADRWDSSEEFVDALERTLSQPAKEPTKPTRRVTRRAAAAAPVARREDSGEAAAGGGNGRGTAARRGPATPEPRRRSAAPLLIGLGLIALLAVIGAVALAGRGGDDPAPRTETTPEATATASPEKTAEPTPTASPDPTETPSPDPTEAPTEEPTPATPTPKPPEKTPKPAGETPKGSPAALQARGHQALLGGDIQGALTNLKAAVDSCGASTQVDPCAYAMYDYASALVAAGRPAEAVPVLEARLQRFDNQNGTVKALLKKAQKAAKG